MDNTSISFWTSILILIGSFLVNASPNLLVTNRRDIRLLDANDTNNTRVLENLDVTFTTVLDFQCSGNRSVVFWQDAVGREITASLLDNENTTKLWRIEKELALGLAYDWIGGNIYWSELRSTSIKVANRNGLMEKALYYYDIKIPGNIAVDPHIKFIFWLDRSESGPKIERAGMDGDPNSREIIVQDGIQRPIALALDLRESKIYFSDNILKFIDICDYDGTNRRRIRNFGYRSEVMSMSVYHSVIYGIVITQKLNITGCTWDCYKRGPIFRFDKVTGNDYLELTDLAHPQTLKVMDPDLQLPGTSPCQSNNGGCSHLCLLSPRRPNYKCACPTGVKFIDSINKTCADGIENALLLGRKYRISTVSMDTTDYFREDIRVVDMYKVLQIDYDPQQERFYWLQRAGYSYIKRARLDGSDNEVVVDRQLDINGFTLDVKNRYIYYTSNKRRKSILRVDMNGNSKTTVVRSGLSNPYVITIDADTGYLYWTDVGYPPKIERFNLDTRERLPLVTTGIRQPDAIYIDKTEGKIYWADSGLDKIEVINEDGTGRRVIVQESLIYDQGLTIFGDKLYFLSYTRELIQVDKATGEGRRKILESDGDLRAMTTIKLS